MVPVVSLLQRFHYIPYNMFNKLACVFSRIIMVFARQAILLDYIKYYPSLYISCLRVCVCMCVCVRMRVCVCVINVRCNARGKIRSERTGKSEKVVCGRKGKRGRSLEYK